MSELILWQKREFDRMRQDLERLFKRFRKDFGFPRSLLEPPEPFELELFDTEDSLTFRVKLPGMDPCTIRVTVSEDVLTIQGQSREETLESKENYHRVEKRSQSISRSIPLPCRVRMDEVEATYTENTLKVVLPKCKPRTARKVEIKTG